MNDSEFCKSVIGVSAPWEVTRVKITSGEKRIDIWVGIATKGGLLSRASKALKAGPVSSWRHLNMANHQVYVHCENPDAIGDHTYSWVGQPGLELTRGMAKRVVRLLSEGVSYGLVCAILKLQLKDVWPIKRALDEGRLLLGGKRVTVAQKRKAANTSPEDSLNEPGNESVPAIDAVVWERVAAGDMDEYIRPIALKLLVTKIRGQLQNIHDREDRLVKLNEIRRYVVKHERSLERELAFLNEHTAS